MVIISTMGRKPTMAAPMAKPTMPGSTIGVSTTRRAMPGTMKSFFSTPYLSYRPSVTRNVPR